MGNDRQIAVHHNALGSALVSGDGNTVSIYHYHLDAQAAIATPAPTPEASKTIGANPYRGLSAFQVEDADVYFGREVQVDRLWNRLQALGEGAGRADAPPRLLPILGSSGCGKSSLARAGLLPELARRPLSAYRQPRVVVMTPGSTPLESLAVVLARIATGDVSPVEKAAEFERVLRRANDAGKQDGLKRIANALPGIETSPLVVLIDQFEEVYSLCKVPQERIDFIDGLIEAATAIEGRVLVVITLRSDFLGETQRHPQLNKIIGSDQVVVVPAMDEEELRRAIAEPAKQAGQPLDEATIDLLIEQSKGREGALPLLQFALTRIWEGMRADKTPSETLRAINGVGGALAGKAQEIYDSLKTKEQDFARRLFIGVVELGEGTKDTRRRAPVESLVSPQDEPALVQTVIGRFSAPGARLLTLSSAEEKEVVEVTHEALFDHWQQLQGWLDGQRDRIRQWDRIKTLAEEWKTQNKNRGYLLQGRQLDDAKEFQTRYASTLPLSGLAAELVRKSLRQRWVNRMLVASFTVIPLIVIEGFLRERAVMQDYTTLRQDDVAAKTQAVLALTVGCGELHQWSSLLYPIGERIFGNCRSLSRQNLNEVDLRDANLSMANLSMANLSRANLSEANLSAAILDRANLREADLSRANLSRNELSRNELSWNLSSSTNNGWGSLPSTTGLNEADLSDANLSEADLRGADLIGTKLSMANLSGAKLSMANLFGANLSRTNLSNADLSDANLCQSTGINPDQIKQSQNWTEASYTKEFRAELGLPLLSTTDDPCNY